MNSGRPRKKTRLDKTIEIRVEATEKQGFAAAAELAGIPLSTWIRERLRQVSIRELEGAGRPIPFIQEMPLGGSDV